MEILKNISSFFLEFRENILYNEYRINVDKVIKNRKNVDNMKPLIHTYIHVLLKNRKNKIFVDNLCGARFYRIIIDSGPVFSCLKKKGIRL